MQSTIEMTQAETLIENADRQRRWLRRAVWAGVAFVVAAILIVVGYPLYVRWQLRQHGCYLDNMYGETGFRGRAQTWLDERFGRVDGAQLRAHFESETLQVRDLELLRRFPNVTSVTLKLTDVSEPALVALAELPNVEMIHFDTAQLDAKGLRHLAKLPKLWQIQMNDMNLKDSDLENLAMCRQIHQLSLFVVTVPEESFRHLTQLPLLECLILRQCGISNRELEDITNCQTLNHFEFSFSLVDDAGALSLSRLTQLRMLGMSTCGVSDIGARRIVEGCPSLRILRIDNVPMTDAAVAEFAKLANLGSLTLERIPVTDSGILPLASCSTLKSLTVRSSKMTATGVADLRTRSPKLGIFID